MQLTITGYSTALFATWYFIEELGILFDAGDGVSAGLLQKSRKINHIFISHADRDHLTGLLQLNQLNAREGYPKIYYPENCGSFNALEAFSIKFDPHVAGTCWNPVNAETKIRLRDDLLIQPIKNGHIMADGKTTKSLSYKIIQTRKKLRPELALLNGLEIKKLTEQMGKDFTTTEERTTLLGFSGDTPVEDFGRWDNTEILIHEATFLTKSEYEKGPARGNKHSTLEEVMEMVGAINIGKLILGHFSSRYTSEQIDREIKRLCEKHAINIPVFRVLPGETARDILRGLPLNK